MSHTPLASLVLTTLDDLKGIDISCLDVRPLTSLMDSLIIVTGNSSRHVKALAQTVVRQAKKAGQRPLSVEGTLTGEWVLVDLGEVVIHVMLQEVRAFYDLESLWKKATLVETVDQPTSPHQ